MTGLDVLAEQFWKDMKAVMYHDPNDVEAGHYCFLFCSWHGSGEGSYPTQDSTLAALAGSDTTNDGGHL